MPCRTSLARPDEARRINIFHLSVAAGAEWCCQVASGGVVAAMQAGIGEEADFTWAEKVEAG